MENKKCEETHTACNERLSKEGSQARCCYCNPHEGCKLFSHKQEEQQEKEEYNTEVGKFYFCKECMPSVKDFYNKLMQLHIKEQMEEDNMTNGTEEDAPKGDYYFPTQQEPAGDWENKMEELLVDFGKDIYFEGDPHRSNGTSKEDIKTFIKSILQQAREETKSQLIKEIEAVATGMAGNAKQFEKFSKQKFLEHFIRKLTLLKT